MTRPSEEPATGPDAAPPARSEPAPAGYGAPAESGPPAGYGAPAGYGGAPGYGAPPAPYGYGYPPGPWQPAGPVAPLSPGGQPLAGFGERLAAYLIDALIAGAVAMAVFLPAFLIFYASVLPELIAVPSDGDPNPSDSGDMFGAVVGPLLLLEVGLIVFLLLLYYLYYVEFMHRTGQTVGKKLMKLRVVPLDPRAPLTRGIATKRYLVEFVGAMFVPFLPYLDGLWQLWDKPFQQCLHDKFAGTVVVKVWP